MEGCIYRNVQVKFAVYHTATDPPLFTKPAVYLTFPINATILRRMKAWPVNNEILNLRQTRMWPITRDLPGNYVEVRSRNCKGPQRGEEQLRPKFRPGISRKHQQFYRWSQPTLCQGYEYKELCLFPCLRLHIVMLREARGQIYNCCWSFVLYFCFRGLYFEKCCRPNNWANNKGSLLPF